MRSSGILLPVSALPSPHGIGTFGKAAYDFADFLKSAGQKYWQVLPLGHTSYGDSPYQAFSTFAGNPYFIDLDMLADEGLLKPEEIAACDFGDCADRVDYGRLYAARYDLLRLAFMRDERLEERESFNAENAAWLPNYALFMAIKKHFGMRSFLEWEDDDIRTHKPKAVKKYAELLKEDVDFYTYLQFLFFSQWNELKQYVNSLGIKIFGDVPIYVAMDSADTWSDTESFQFDEEGRPLKVAGVPPDYFSEDGQLWGNPLYNWERMKKNGYKWWIDRIAAAGKLYDTIRIDHFRGFDTYYAIDADAKTAREGEWVQGPGMDLISVIQGWFGSSIDIVAEDLGDLFESSRQLLRDSGLPGMKVLQFAFDSKEQNDFLPHTYTPNFVVYTGTHDNNTLLGWMSSASEEDLRMAERYLGLNGAEGYNWGFIRGAMSSVAKLAMVPIQDYLGLGRDCRMNTPSTLGCNWMWRVREEALSTALAERILEITKRYGR